MFIEYERCYLEYEELRLSPWEELKVVRAQAIQPFLERQLPLIEKALLNLFGLIPAYAKPTGQGLFAICFGRWTSDDVDEEGNYKFQAGTKLDQPLTPNSTFDNQIQG